MPYKLEVENEFNEAETSYYNYKMYDTFETQLTKDDKCKILLEERGIIIEP